MKTLATLCLSALGTISLGATLSAQWNFEGSLDSALPGGQPLVASAHLSGYEPTADPVLVFTTDNVNDGLANVLRFENNEWGNGYLIAPHNLAANGRGAYVNQYTLIMDVKVDHTSGEGWQALAGTNYDTYNDADFYFRLDGSDGRGEYAAIGIGNYGGQIYWNEWNRIAITVDAENTIDGMKFYANGTLVHARSGGGLDDRWTLYSTADTTPWLILFGEGDSSGNYTNPIYVSSVQVYDGMLTDGEILALGAATADKLPGGGTVTTVTGKIVLDGYAGDATQVPIVVALVDAGGVTGLSKTVYVDGTGSFSLTTALSGTYRVLAKGPSFLRRELGTVSLSGGSSDSGSATLLAGDIDDDNAITVFDYNLLSEFFDKTSSDSDWLTVSPNGFAPVAADLDGDEAVTVFDYNLLSKNFDQVGDE